MTGLIEHITSNVGEIAKVVGKFAPVLATALGSPVGGLVLGLIANLFGVSQDKISELSTVISGDSDAATKLKALENAHAETLRQFVSQDYRTEVDDRMDARKYGTAYQGFLKVFAYVVTAGFFGALILFFFPIPMPDNSTAREMLSMLVGMLASKWQTIIDFFYGSSHPENKSNLG